MNIPLFVIDQNIKKDKMKENKQIKEVFEGKDEITKALSALTGE